MAIPNFPRPSKASDLGNEKLDDSAHQAGRAARTALQVMPKIPGALGEMTGVPAAVRSAGTAIGNFTSGLAGGSAPGTTPAPIARPDAPVSAPMPVQPAPVAAPNAATLLPTPAALAPVDPARHPASQASSTGATAPTGGAPALVPGLSTLSGTANLAQRGQASDTVALQGPARPSLASSRGAHGENVYDNASIERLNGRMGQPASGGGVAAQSFGGTAPGMPVQPVVARPSLNAPQRGGGQAAIIGADRVGGAGQERTGALSLIDDQIRAIGTANTRGKRDLLANLMAQRNGLTQQAGNLAGRDAEARLDASTRTNVAQMSEHGQNARAELGEAGDTHRTGMNQTGEDGRTALTQAGLNFREMNRPEYMPDKDGNVTQVSGGISRPVTDIEGKPLSVVTTQQQKATERQQEVLDSISDRAFETLPVGGHASFQQIKAARAQAAMTNGFEVAINANGDRMIRIDGEWVPL